MCAWKLTPQDWDRIKLLAITLLITIVLSLLLKGAIDLKRPCDPVDEAYCPPGYAYPSLHTSAAFAFVFPLFGHPLLPIAYVLALLTGWSRVLLHVHTLYDIAGGIAVAGFGYNIASCLIRPSKSTPKRAVEYARQMLHATLGLILALAILQLGIDPLLLPLLLIFLGGILIIHVKVLGMQIPVIDQLLTWYERDEVLPGEGSFYFGIGVLFTLGLLRQNPAAATAVILILSLGDALATGIGMRFGRHRLPWNNKKTLEGSIGFAIGGLAALLIFPVAATVIALIFATILESLPLRLDDNSSIPIATSLLLYFLI